MNLPSPLLLLTGAGVFLAGSHAAWAQMRLREYQEPQLLTMKVDQVYSGVYAEWYERTTTTAGGASLRETRQFLGPLVGLSLSGAIYHPNLLAYRLTLDGSFGQTKTTYGGTGASQSNEELRFLGSFFGELHWLDSKPLHGRFFANFTHAYLDYDFFNRTYTDTWRYGGDINFEHGPFTWFATAYQETQDGSVNDVPTTSEAFYAATSLTHARASGSSSIGASLSDYARDDFRVTTTGTDYGLSVADAEDFGARQQMHSRVNAGLNHFEGTADPTDLYTGTADLRVDHTARLATDYTANYSRTTSGPTESDNVSGAANVRHQLYDSLASSFGLEGYRYTITSGAARQDSTQFGGGPAFNYTKRLSARSVLTANEAFHLLHTEVTSSGGVIPVLEEPHFFNANPGGDTFTLQEPYVIRSSIVITDTARQPPGGYLLGLDYDVIPNGALTTIRRLVGSRMPDSVLVSYSFNASPSGGFDTLRNSAGLRVDFYDNRLGIYTRLNLERNRGSPELVVENLNDWVTGVEGNWRAWRGGIEYEIYDSDLSPFTALRLFQSITFMPAEASTVSINFTESFVDYEEAGRREQNYTATLRYNRRLNRRLGFNVDLGASQRTGTGVDQTLAIFRPQLQYVAGKLSATVGYDYSYDEYLNTQTRVRNLGFIRLRRDF